MTRGRLESFPVSIGSNIYSIVVALTATFLANQRIELISLGLANLITSSPVRECHNATATIAEVQILSTCVVKYNFSCCSYSHKKFI
jgi:hypothetical protein